MGAEMWIRERGEREEKREREEEREEERERRRDREKKREREEELSLIHIRRCRRSTLCSSRWTAYT